VSGPVLVTIGEGLGELAFASGAGGLTLAAGGDAANIAVMAARLGAPVRLLGRVGADGFGARLVAFWREHGIDVEAVRIDPSAPTGLYLNETAEDGHRFTYWRTGSAGSRLEPADIGPAVLDDVGLLVVTGVTLAVSRSCADAAGHAVGAARARGAWVACVLNHRPALGGDVAELAAFARASDIVLGSREDADAVFGTADPWALRRLLADGPSELVLTDGAAPAVVFEQDEAWRRPVPSVSVRNAGGAGDALAGAYLAARLRGDAPVQSLAWGVAAAAASVQREGCASAYPTARETAELLRRLPPAVRLAERAPA
jgi:2-dehydro-3-deoxygluconokinase